MEKILQFLLANDFKDATNDDAEINAICGMTVYKGELSGNTVEIAYNDEDENFLIQFNDDLDGAVYVSAFDETEFFETLCMFLITQAIG